MKTKKLPILAIVAVMLLNLIGVPFVLASDSTVTTNTCFYDEQTGIVTVSGYISTPGASVTILVLGAETQGESLSDLIIGQKDETIANLIAYIDQAESDDTTGAFNFTFTRRDGVLGNFLNVNIGGEGVAAPLSQNIMAVPNGPALSGAAFYGDAIELTFTDSEAWRTAISSIKVDNTDMTSQAVVEAGKITLPAIMDQAKTSITVTVVADGFKDNVATVVLSAKTAGTITAQSASVIALDEPIKFNLTDSMGWVSKITTAKINDVATNDFTIDGNVLSVPVSNFVLSNTEADKIFTVAIAVVYYNEVSANVKVKAPTTAVVLPESVAATYPPDDLAFGDATVLVPTIAEKNGTNILWTLDTGAGAQAVSEGQSIVVPRPEEGSDDLVVTLRATVTKGDYIPVEKTYAITIEAKGVAGINIDISLDSSRITAAALELATVTVDGVATTRNGHTFTTAPISAGTHTAVISRPGFVTKTIIFETSAEAALDASVITSVVMIAGDVNNDGKINLQDYGFFGQSWGNDKNNMPVGKVWDDRTDFNGDGKVNLQDYGLFGQNWSYDITKY